MLAKNSSQVDIKNGNLAQKKYSNIVFLIFSVLISLIFLSSILKSGPLDLENYNCGVIYSALIRAQHFLKGQFLLWCDSIGFGTPFPISPLIDLHPFFALSPFLSMKIVRLLFWLIHLSAGSFFFMKLCRLLGISRLMSLISGFLYVFSLPTINYTITDDWVSNFVGWTMSPIIAFFIFKLFFQNERKFNYLIFLLPIIFAFTLFNAPTYLQLYVILFFCILLIFLYHPKKNRVKQLLIVFILTSTTIIFVVALAYNYYASKMAVMEEVAENAKNLTMSTAYRIEVILRGVEKVPRNLAGIIEEYPYSSKDLFRLIKNAIASNDEVFGVAIAFEPYGFDPGSYYFSPYGYRENDRIDLMFLGGDDYITITGIGIKSPRS